MTDKLVLDQLSEKILEGKRITPDEAKHLYEDVDLLTLGQLAHELRLRKTDPNIASYIIDRNINYTNTCVTHCQFCAFYRKVGDDEGYVLENEVIKKKVLETKELGGTGILMQGGLNPKLRMDYYQELLRFIKSVTDIHVHAFSPPEIVYMCQLEKKPMEEILTLLMEAGLDSIPGGGAEILVDRVRNIISPKKCTADEWLQVMETAHKIGLKTTATMMFGHVETLEERIEHMDRIRHLQDKTGGFTAFIPWTFQKGETLVDADSVYAYDYLKTLSLARIYLDNIENIQGSWVTQGDQIGQMSLFFGANDLGSIMIEENVVSSAGTSFLMSEKIMTDLISDSGFTPFKRNTLYTNISYKN